MGQENPVPTIANSRFYEVQKHLTLSAISSRDRLRPTARCSKRLDKAVRRQ